MYSPVTRCRQCIVELHWGSAPYSPSEAIWCRYVVVARLSGIGVNTGTGCNTLFQLNENEFYYETVALLQHPAVAQWICMSCFISTFRLTTLCLIVVSKTL